jgi:hypothetical protein
MKSSILVFLVLLLFTSCSMQSRLDRKCRKANLKYAEACLKWNCPSIKDSTVTNSIITIRDTTIFIPVPAETVHDSIPVIITKGLMSTPVSILETTYSRSKAWVQNGTLKHTLDQKPSTFPVIIPGAIHNSTSSTKQTIKVPYYFDRPIKKPLSWWQKLFIWSGVIAWCVGLGYVAFRITKYSRR